MIAKQKNKDLLSIEEFKALSKKTPAGKAKAVSKGLAKIKADLKYSGIAFQEEYPFAKPERAFLFDIAFPEIKVAIEYEGIFSDKSRHTSYVGYSRDTEKYNLAAILGWRVLRYTGINYSKALSDYRKIISLN